MAGAAGVPGCVGSRLLVSPEARWAVLDKTNGCVVLELQSGRIARKLANLRACAFSPDGRRLVLVGRSDYVVIETDFWNEQLTIPLDRSRPGYRMAAFDPSGESLAVIPCAHLTALFDLDTGEEIARLEGPGRRNIRVMEFVLGGRRLVVLSGKNRIEAWDLPSLGRRLAAFGFQPAALTRARGSAAVETIAALGRGEEG